VRDAVIAGVVLVVSLGAMSHDDWDREAVATWTRSAAVSRC
jgi:hypothetical protein